MSPTPAGPLHILALVDGYPPGLDALGRLDGVTVKVQPARSETGPEEFPSGLLRDKQALLCSYPPANLDDMRQLKWIQITSAGYSQLIPCELPRRGIRATNGLGNFDVPIAEWNVAMMVNLARDLRGMVRNQKKGVWDRSARFQREIRGSVVGLWGYGGIGRETARLAKAFGMKVHVLARSGIKPRSQTYRVSGTGDPEGKLPDRVFSTEQQEEFLKSLDFLVLGMPLTKATEGMIGERELRMLPRHACVLNPARGPLIQEAALLRALRDGWIAGAALDTHYHYPMPSDHPLWSFPQVIMTPHISGSGGSTHYQERIWDIFAQNVRRYRDNEPLLNELTVAQLEGK